MKDTITAFASAIKEAQLYADQFKNTPDVGSCNLDTVMYDFTGWNQYEVNKLSSLTGLEIGDRMTGIYSGNRFIFFNADGQANLRNKMVTEAKNKMRELGYNCSIWYQMD